MALSQRNKVQLIQGSGAVASSAVNALLVSVATSLVAGGAGATATIPFAIGIVGPLIPILALTIQATRPRFPQIKPSQLGETLAIAEDLRRRGLEPVISTDPFTGNVLVGSADQPLQQLALEAAIRSSGQPTQSEVDELFELRQQLIQAKKATAIEKGFFATTASIPNVFPAGRARLGLRCGVFRETADSPLEFRCFS